MSGSFSYDIPLSSVDIDDITIEGHDIICEEGTYLLISGMHSNIETDSTIYLNVKIINNTEIETQIYISNSAYGLDYGGGALTALHVFKVPESGSATIKFTTYNYNEYQDWIAYFRYCLIRLA